MTSREPTAIDRVADDYTMTLARLDPMSATFLGISGFDHLMTDLSPEGLRARQEHDRATLATLDSTPPQDDTDVVTIAAMKDQLGLAVELYEAGETFADLNVIASPLQGVRDVFDLMLTDTEEQWSTIAQRLGGVPGAVLGYVESLREGARRGLIPAALQLREGIGQADELADPASSFFVQYAQEARAGKDALPSSLRADLERGALAAAGAYRELAGALRELEPRAPLEDACGRERYALHSRYHVSAAVDLDETYEWGLDELARLKAEQEEVVRQIAGPDASVADAVAVLDADPRRRLHGTRALQKWMQLTADQAVKALDDLHFDIPAPVETIECLIAPTHNGGIYYTGPSDDFSRPGRMWWSVPPGVTEFNTWREKTTVYHEGVPGHHLQIGQAVYNRAQLNLWRRLVCWTSGHGEGWALYAERLMEEFGFMDDPGDRFGLLDGQRMRATRVVLDIGVHLKKRAPAEWGGGTWDAEKAWHLLRSNVNMDDAFVRFELNRYLGWPGQAPSYKIGQRLWEQIRAEVAAREGEAFSLKNFHTKALNLGSLPLDVLRGALTS